MSEGRLPGIAWLGVVLGLAFAARLVGIERVFPGGDEVVFAFGDAYYHLRRALYTFELFPRVLSFDPYMNFPHGAHVPWGPLYDLFVAGSARLIGDSVVVLERVAAWWPPVLGTLTTATVFVMGGRLGGRALGLGAALICAVLPAASSFSRIGYADHHGAVALLVALLILLQLVLLSGLEASRSKRISTALALVATRLTLVFTWPGSLMLLAVGDIAVILLALVSTDRRVLVLEVAGLLATALLMGGLVAAFPPGLGGDFSVLRASWLHVVGCAAMAAWAGLCLLPFTMRGSAPLRLGIGTGLGALVALPILFAPPVWAGLGLAEGFLSGGDLWSQANPEQAPLLASGISFAVGQLGWMLLLLAVPPILWVLHARDASRPAPKLLAAVWYTALSVLALLQLRFLNELAPIASVGFAAVVAAAVRRLGSHMPRVAPWRGAIALGLGAALLAPALGSIARPAWQGLKSLREGARPGSDPLTLTPEGSAQRFAEMIRQHTPETAGWMGEGGDPDYAVLADPSLGQVIHYVARRPTPSNNFGPYIGEENFLDTLRVLVGSTEADAWEILQRMQARYVVTNWQPHFPPGSLLARLHLRDGRAQGGMPTVAHFRLVVEGPRGGLPLAALFMPTTRGVMPYKLFEAVPGAVLEVPGQPGERVTAALRVKSPHRLPFAYRVKGVIGEDGLARLRVAYPTATATATATPVRAEGPYSVEVQGRAQPVHVSEQDVRSGHVVRLAPLAP